MFLPSLEVIRFVLYDVFLSAYKKGMITFEVKTFVFILVWNNRSVFAKVT